MSGNPLGTQVVSVGAQGLEGVLRVPAGACALVIFAHGAGSSHLSTRNNHVADVLGRRGIATLLFDLLSEAEAADRANVFDVALLSHRMIDAMDWARSNPDIPDLPLGLFGSSTGAAAALVAAAHAPFDVGAVVSRGGRPDMAAGALPKVRAPVLLIVGGADTQVIDLNRAAAQHLTCEHRIEIVPGATHLFEEPGALDQVIELAGDWYLTHLSAPGQSPQQPESST
ncbi:dienelactone hydrolase family protein [Arenibacterium sp. CAU 1754]